MSQESAGDGDEAILAADASGRVTRLNAAAERLTGWTQAEAVGHFLGEVTRNRAEEQRRERESKQSAARLQVLVETSRQFSSTVNVHDLLALIVRRVSEVVGDLCAIRLVAKDRAWLEPTGALHHPDPELLAVARAFDENVRQRVGEGISGKVAATGASILIPVVDTEALVAQSEPKFRSLIERLAITSSLNVPLKSQNRVLGVINLTRSGPGNPYTAEDQELAQDLADRAALAMENALLLSELEARVAERTAALEEANRELEAFSYSVAHDLRAPLRSIGGFGSILMDDWGDRLDDGGRHHLRRIIDNAVSMGQLIDALLSLANLARTEMRCKALDLVPRARSVMDELRAAEPERVVEFVAPESVVVHGDPRLLGVVLENLLRNAWKFTREQRDARIELLSGKVANAHLCSVRDNGAGFQMEFANKLFRPFQRLHSVERFEGTGIGLATVERIIRRHGGRVSAEGAEGCGATFHFTLPEEARV